MRSSTRKVAAIGILVAWGASIAWLAVRTGGDRDDSSSLQSAASLRLSPGDSWFQVLAGPVPLGIAGVTLDTLGSGYRIRETITLDLPRDSAVIRANRTTEYMMGPDLTLRSSISRDGILGERRQFDFATEAGGWTLTVSRSERPVARGSGTGETPMALAIAPYRLALTGSLGDGGLREISTVAGWPMATDEASYRVLRDTLVIFADSATQLPESGDWVAAHWDSAAARTVMVQGPAGPVILHASVRGTLVGLEYPLGVRWIRTDFDLIKRAPGPGTMATNFSTVRPDLPVLRPLSGSGITLSASDTVVAYVLRHRDGRRIGSERVQLFATDGIAYRSEHDSLGRPIGDILVVGAAPSPGSRIPQRTVQDPLSQEASPRLRSFADSFRIGTGTDFDRLAARLERIRVDTSSDAPVDALGTLQAGRGSPDGVARLAVTILRLHGWRARYALGIVPVGDTLYTHAWVEQWLPADRRWAPLDPRTLHPLPASLLRLALAGSSHPADMLPMVADLRIVRTTPDSPSAGEGNAP